MSRVFAILHEPASYTLDRNINVYDPLDIEYCYISSSSKANELGITDEVLSNLSLKDLVSKLKKILKSNEVIIMNGYNGKYFLLLFILNLFYHRKIGIDSDTPLYIPQNPIKRFVKSLFLNTIFRNKHIHGLAGGTGSHMDLFRHYGMKEDRIFLMPMVVDSRKFLKQIPPIQSPHTFLYVGRIVEAKNIDLMIRAFIMDFGEESMVKLRIVGDGALLPSLREKYNAYSNIIFTGPKFGQDLIDEYHNASTLVLPSNFEPWGLVVNEAMASGLPVIVSDRVGAAHDLVEGKDTGLIFKYDSDVDLADKMKVLIDNPTSYNRMAKNALNLIQNHWNYSLYCDCLLNFISKN